MKKWGVLITLGILVFVLTACASEPFTCEICRKEKNGKKYTNKVTSILLEDEKPICEECYMEIKKALGN